MPASGALSLGTKLRLGSRYLPFLSKHAAVLDTATLPLAADAGLDGESIAEWGARELGREFVDYLVDPLLASYYGVEPEETTAALYHMLANHGTSVSVYALEGGVSAFPELLASRIREHGGAIRTGSRVEAVSLARHSVTVRAGGATDVFDGAVVAVPGHLVPALLPDLAGPALDWFRGVRYRPLAALALLLDRPVGARYFGLSFPGPEAGLVSAVCVEENKAEGLGLVPPGRGLLVALLSPPAVPTFLDAAPARVLDRVLPELEKVFPGVARSVQRVKLYRWPEGGPVFYPGYLRHLNGYEPALRAVEAPILFAGDYLVAPGPEGAVIGGLRAADRLLARLPPE
jgi:protoporphyrinogen/coproporphyrinogen III oxidase